MYLVKIAVDDITGYLDKSYPTVDEAVERISLLTGSKGILSWPKLLLTTRSGTVIMFPQEVLKHSIMEFTVELYNPPTSGGGGG